MTAKLLGKIAWDTFQWVGLLGGVLGVLIGLALIFKSSLIFKISERMNVWISTRQAMRPLDEPFNVDRAIYRSHRWLGFLLAAGALFTLYAMLLRFKGPELSYLFSKFFHIQVAVWLGLSTRIFLIAINIAALGIAIAMIIRPSALKHVETWTNRHFSARRATRVWEIPRTGADTLVQAYPRLVGTFLTISGLCVVLVLAVRLVWH